MSLNPSNSSDLEQLALNGLNISIRILNDIFAACAADVLSRLNEKAAMAA